MKNTSIIRQLAAGVLLILFAFGITPKKSLHDLITNHGDEFVNVCHSEVDHFHKEGFNCKCDTFVAESPFTTAENTVELPVGLPFSVLQSIPSYNYNYTAPVYIELRGPPVAC